MGHMPEYAMTYVAWWPGAVDEHHGIIKVGRAWRWSRIQQLSDRGAQIAVCARGTNWTWEYEALKILRYWFPRAFRWEFEAYKILPYGRGFTECFVVHHHDRNFALDLILDGFAKGDEPGVNPPKDYKRSGSQIERIYAHAEQREADRFGAMDPYGCGGAPAADSGADSGGRVSGAGSSGSGTGRHPDARRGGIPDDLHGTGWDGVDRTDAPAESGSPGRASDIPATSIDHHDDQPASAPDSAVPVPVEQSTSVSAGEGKSQVAASSRFIAKDHGCGGRVRGRERVGRARAGRAGARVGALGARAGARAGAGGAGITSPSVDARCPADWLPGSSKRAVCRLRALRYRPPPA